MKRENFTRRKSDPAIAKCPEEAILSSSGSLHSLTSASGLLPCTQQDADRTPAGPREQLGTLLLEWLESLGFQIPASLSGSLYEPVDDLHFSGKRLQDIEQRLSKFKKAKSLPGKNKPSGEIYIDNTDLMNLLHISPRTSRHWRTQGRIFYSRVGKKLFFRLADVEEMLEKYKVGGRRPP